MVTDDPLYEEANRMLVLILLTLSYILLNVYFKILSSHNETVKLVKNNSVFYNRVACG